MRRLHSRILSLTILGLILVQAISVYAQREWPNSFRNRDRSSSESTTKKTTKRSSRPQVVVVRKLDDYQRVARAYPKHELIDLMTLLPELEVDLRYATTRNFMSEKMYPETARPLLRRDAAERLARVQSDLAKEGLGLKIFDAYRPWNVTRHMWNSRKKKGVHARFLAPPWIGSNHNRGVAVDVTLIDLKTGQELEMPTGFDSFSQRAHTNYSKLSSSIKSNREKLKAAMRKHGFHTIRSEWWHFELGNAGQFAVLDLSFEDLATPSATTAKTASDTTREN